MKLNLFLNEIIYRKKIFPSIKHKILNSDGVLNAKLETILEPIVKEAYQNYRHISHFYKHIANFLFTAGYADLANKYFLLSLQYVPSKDTYSLYLQSLLMSPHCDSEEMFTEAKKYDALFLSKIKQYTHHSNQLDTEKKLTIGYLCHFFHNAPSQTLLLPYLKAHNRNQYKIICYSDAQENEVNQSIKNVADCWHDAFPFSDEELAKKIRLDSVDILIELNGHCIKNRYGVIARKPAPIQISHYNISATTGIKAIDYILLGEEFKINQKHYTETIYYHKGVRKALAFPDYFPDCSPPAFIKNGYITFGSFGASHKLNNKVASLWTNLLSRMPTAKLYIKASSLDDLNCLLAVKQLFKTAGANLNQIHFSGYSPHAKMLEEYSQIDIALDTFPYSGATTIREALWQGVPVITLANKDKYCQQHGKAILSSMNHAEWISISESEYIEKAIKLANNLDTLKHYRNNLRNDFKASPLFNLKKWVNHLEEAYQDMWRIYCVRNASRATRTTSSAEESVI